MRLTSLMMYISALLLLVFYVYIGFCHAAPRIRSYDASADTDTDTRETFHTDMPRPSPGGSSSAARGPLTPSPSSLPAIVSKTVTTFQPPTTDPTTTTTRSTSTSSSSSSDTGIITPTDQQTSPQQLYKSTRKRSTDAQSSLFSPEKALQTMMMVSSSSSSSSSSSANDAWAARSMFTSGTSAEISQEVLCNCSSGGEGIMDPEDCDQSTGQCRCMQGYTGLQCDDCEDDHFTNGTTGCMPCACDSFGAVSHHCDSSGICVCKTGVYGPKCDECHPGFFHFSNTGCRPCQCHNHTNYCHPQSGVCLNCEGNTQGSNCEECKPGFYRSPATAPTEACAPCPCSNATSTGTCGTGQSSQHTNAECDHCLTPETKCDDDHHTKYN